MNDYVQPDFYRFNQDSLNLVLWIKGKVLKARSLLDLGAGSGVIGIELAKHFGPSRLVLVELQEDYRPYLEENLRTFQVQAEIEITRFSKFVTERTFDLIVCNPPYYLVGKGELPKDPRRQVARAFIEDGWEELLLCIKRSLAQNGIAFIVLKNEAVLKREVERTLRNFSFAWQMNVVEDLIYLELSGLNVD